MWFFFTILGHLMNAFVFLTDKAFISKIFPSPKALAFISGASGIFTFVLFPWYLTGGSMEAVAASILSGAITIFALVLFFTAIGRDEVSRVVPAVGSMTPIFTFAVSYFILDELLTDRYLLAFILLTIGGIVIAFRSFTSLFRRKDFSLFLLEVFVAFLFALGVVLQKYGFNGMDDFSSFLWSRIGGVAAAISLLFYQEVRERLSFQEIREGGPKKGILYVVSRIFAGISPLVIVLAVSFGSATLVNALQGIQYIFLYVLALLFAKRFPEIFKEEFRRGAIVQKSIALLFISFGLLFLT